MFTPDSTALQSLESLVRFAGARHRVLAHDIANLETPGFQPVDVSPAIFQESLGEALDAVREGRTTLLAPPDRDGIRFAEDSVMLEPKPRGDNLLFHDRTDADMERLLSDLAENTLAFRAAGELIRNRYALIASAIRERP